MTEIYTFKQTVKQLINEQTMKVWLAKKRGRRVDYIVKIGTEQFVSPITIYENDQYVLLGQNIHQSLKNKLKEEVERYAKNT